MLDILIFNIFRWRQTHDSDEEEEAAESASAESGSEEESSDEDAGEKGAHALIEIENPNRVHKKAVQKVSALNIETASATSSGGSKSGNGPKPELSRREREEIDKQKAQAAYQKLHSQGKTEQAKADLARLAIIKQQRQEAADRREKERKGKLLISNYY